MTSNRKFHKASIDGLKGLDSNRMLKFFEKYGGDTRELNLSESSISNATVWCQVLETMMPNLTKLSMTKMKASGTFEDILLGLRDLPHLKTLEIVESSFELLKFFERCQIQNLKVVCPNDDDQTREPLLNFLATQNNLKELSLQYLSGYKSTQPSNLFRSAIPNDFIPFRLKKLLLLKIRLAKPLEYVNALRFMKLHAESLEELEMGWHFREFFDLIFTDCKQLKTLSLLNTSPHQIPQLKSVYERLPVNKSVTRLNIIGSINWGNDVFPWNELVNLLPSIENVLIIGYCNNALLQHIVQSCKKIKIITVAFYHGNMGLYGIHESLFQAFESKDTSKFSDIARKVNPGMGPFHHDVNVLKAAVPCLRFEDNKDFYSFVFNNS